MTDQVIINQHSHNPDDPDGSLRRYTLLRRNFERAEQYVGSSPNKDLCISIIDLSEYKDFPGVDKLWIEKVEHDDCIPAMVVAMTREATYESMVVFQSILHEQKMGDPAVSPVVEGLRKYRPGYFYILVVSRGKQLASLPLPV